MPTTLSLPLTTLSTGQQLQAGFGGASGPPTAIPDSATAVTIAIDRTAGASSLNSLVDDLTQINLYMRAEISMDGGVSWMHAEPDPGYIDFHTSGGVHLDKLGNTITQSFVGPNVLPTGTGRLARGLVRSVVGTISFSGTLTLTP